MSRAYTAAEFDPSTEASDAARAAAAVLIGVVVGTLAVTALEALVLHPLGVRTGSRSNAERGLLATALVGWVGACGLSAWAFDRVRDGLVRRCSSPFPLGMLVVMSTAVMLATGRDFFAAFLAVAAALGAVGMGRITNRWRLAGPVLWSLLAVWRCWQVFPDLAILVAGVFALLIIGLLAAGRFRPTTFDALNLVALGLAVVFEGTLSAFSWPAVALGVAAFLAFAQRRPIAFAFTAALLVACIFLRDERLIETTLAGIVLAGWAAASLRASQVAPYQLTWLPSTVLLFGPMLAIFLPPAGIVVLGLGVALLGDAVDAPLEESRIARRRIVLLFMVLAAAARLVFWFMTDRIWEDGLITLRHAENAAQGLGLTHHPAHGRVHGFTSPLNVLVPLVGELVRPGFGMPLFRIVTTLCGAAAVWFAGRIADSIRLSTPAMVFWLTFLALDHSQISYGVAGMETQIWVAVLLGGAWAVAERRWRTLATFLVLAGLSRPEGGIWIVLGLVAVAQKAGAKTALRTAATVALGLAPWVVFTTWYYGSPVPHTMIAKARGYLWGREIVGILHDFSIRDLIDRLLAGLSESVVPHLGPYFFGNGYSLVPTSPFPGETRCVILFFVSCGVVALAARGLWIVPAFLVGVSIYLIVLVQMIFCWYPVPLLALAMLACAFGVDRWTSMLAGRWIQPARWTICLLVAAAYTSPLPATFATEGAIQRLIEDGVRKEIGLWLAAHSDPQDEVAIECLGYVGYYSRLPIHDIPGLSSPRATNALAEAGGDNFLWPIVDRLKPRWVVLRFSELAVPPEYKMVHRVAAPASYERELAKHLPVQTRDGEFYILERRTK